jgi:predicted TIM-barrel fold metal-dependent hydrolase
VNDGLAEAAATDGNRLIGLARVDPLLGDAAAAEPERALDAPGLAGALLVL